MRVARVSITNFNIIESGIIDFRKCSHVVAILGETNSAGADSNGSGKTSVIDAICWATFGQELPRASSRKRPVQDVIRAGTDSCTVVVDFEHEGKPLLSVSRSRTRSGSVRLLIDGKEPDTVSGGQEAIERRLGMNYELFTRLIVFAGEISSFCSLTAAERLRMLEGLLGIEHYLVAAERAKEEENLRHNRVQVLEEKESSRRASKQHAESVLRERFFHSVSVDQENAKKIARAREDFQQLLRAHERACKKLRKARLRRDFGKKDFSVQKKKWLERLESLTREHEKIHAELIRAEREEHTASSEYRVLESQIRALEQKKHPDVCPTCRREWPQDGKPVDTKDMHEKLRALRDNRERKQAALEQAKALYLKSVDNKKSHENSRPIPPEESTRLRKAEIALARAEEAVNGGFRRIEQLESFREDRQHWAAFQQALQTFLRLSNEQGTDKKQIAEETRAAEAARFWAESFGRNGIPASLLDSSAPLLTEYAQEYADAMTEGAYSITFELQDSSGRSDFRINVANADGGSSYNDLSKGELARAHLCVLLAIRKFMLERAGVSFDQVFIDEIADGLDARGMECFGNLMRRRTIADQVVFISHHTTLQEVADSVIRVVKRNGASRIKV